VKLSKKLIRHPLLRALLCSVIACYIRLVYTTTRWRVIHSQDNAPQKPALYLFWHGRLFIMPTLFKAATTMDIVVSSHNDGEYIAQVMRSFKFKSIRGSTDRGSTQALRAIIKSLLAGRNIGISPDGPRGPRMRINSNLVAIAQRTGAPVCTVTFSVASCKIFRSWDRFMFPYPFGKGVIIYGTHFTVPADADQAMQADLKQQIETELNRITTEADLLAGIVPVIPDDSNAQPRKRKTS
jgi:lysophospholipid acyltransferase (LPLAT)-like uncharacterized protein